MSSTNTMPAEAAAPVSIEPVDPELRELGGRAMAAKYKLSIAGARPSAFVYAKRLWRARQFIVTWATSQNQALYAGSRLGQIWQVLTPLLNIGVYYLIFGILLGTSRGVPDFLVYLVTGVFLFNFMQSAVLFGSRAISDNMPLIRALYFPRASLPIAITIIQLQQLAIAMIILVTVALVKGEPLSFRWLLIAAVLGLQFIYNVGLAMVVARLGAIVKDSSQLMPFILRTWMYGSGVFYSIKSMTSSHKIPGPVSWALDHNPPLIFIQLARHQLITPKLGPKLTEAQVHTSMFLPAHAWMWAVIWALVFAIGGYLFFWQGEETYGRG